MDHTERQHWNTYANELRVVFDSIELQGKTMLEIAPGECNYAEVYTNAGLGKYICVEPNKQWLRNTQRKIEFLNVAEQYEFVNSTFEEYQCTEPVDIVFSAGLLYHLVSPFHFLEILANYNAEHVVIEHTGTMYSPHNGPLWKNGVISNSHAGGLVPEPTNYPGMRLTDSFETVEHDRENYTNKRFIPLNMFVSCDLIQWCMEKMGYNLEEYNNIETGTMSKHENCVMRFKRAGE